MGYNDALARVVSLGSAIIGVGLAWVLVSSNNTANIAKAIGGTFSGALKTAMGH